jgi:hypothetical protein
MSLSDFQFTDFAIKSQILVNASNNGCWWLTLYLFPDDVSNNKDHPIVPDH